MVLARTPLGTGWSLWGVLDSGTFGEHLGTGWEGDCARGSRAADAGDEHVHA